MNSGRSQSPTSRALDSPVTAGTTETPQPAVAYVTTTGRHKQYINASVLGKVTEQRKRAIQESQQHKAQQDDQWERQRMDQYVAALDAKRNRSNAQGSSHSSSKNHEIKIDGLNFQVLKSGSKLVRIFGPTDTLRSTPKRANVQGVTFVRSKRGNLYRSGVIRASKMTDKAKKNSSLCKSFTKTGTLHLLSMRHCNKGPACLYIHNPTDVAICSTYLQKGICPAGACRKKRCDLPHVDRAGQIRKHAAQSAEPSSGVDSLETSKANDSDLSSDDDDLVGTEGDDIDSDDLDDEFIVGVNDTGHQQLAQQDDFVQLIGKS
ncbi:MAG: hypothetical protein Q9209_002544 [Squamulea sp. 1 TL-2023]